MNPISLLLVSLSPAARAVAIEAARLAFPGATPTDVPSIEVALKSTPAAGPELLLLGEPDQNSLSLALAAVDAGGLRRWALIVFGPDQTDDARIAARLAPEDWNARSVAQAFKSAARLHGLERENARLRGDLSTVGRRISHDLRTPLSAINTACEAIDEIMAGRTTEHAVFTQSIATSTTELAQLIERVSFILKASAELGPIEIVDMDEIVFNTRQRLERRTVERHAVITQPDKWPRTAGVAACLEIIWFNLLANALHHAQPAPQIELGWSEADGVLRFWVNDRGPGVKPEKTGKLFQPFHQMHRLDAPRGLGLALVQRLVELQGGACGYEPLPGGGAHFFFTLPAATPA